MNVAVIFAGGVGKRMGDSSIPKQFLQHKGKSIIIHTLQKFDNHKEIDKIIISCLSGWENELKRQIKENNIKKVVSIVKGGETGQLSIYNALSEADSLFNENSIILIHDGVRPLIDEKLITNCIKSVKEKGSAITVSKAIETVVVLNEDGKIKLVEDRESCKMAKAPQCFRLKDLIENHQKAQEEGLFNFTDTATLMSYYGAELNTVDCPPTNIKITTPQDFYTFKALIDNE